MLRDKTWIIARGSSADRVDALRSVEVKLARAPVAQLDRVLVSEAKGHRFDSCRARQRASDFAPGWSLAQSVERSAGIDSHAAHKACFRAQSESARERVLNLHRLARDRHSLLVAQRQG